MTLRTVTFLAALIALSAVFGCSSENGGGGGCVLPQLSCNGACVNAAEDNNNCGACGSRCDAVTTSCVQGRCLPLCPNGQSRCGGACVNTSSDQQNCGMCNMRCGPGTICTDGVCEVACSAGLTACETAKGDGGATAVVCVNTDRDPSNCCCCGNR